MSFINFFSGFVRLATTPSFVAVLVMTSGCVIAPMRVQFDPCVGQVAGSATLGGLAGGILGGRTGAIAGAVGAGLATAIQGCHPQGQAGQPMVARPQVIILTIADDCYRRGWPIRHIGGDNYTCDPPPALVVNNARHNSTRTGYCLYTLGSANDPYAGIRKGPRPANDEFLRYVLANHRPGPGEVVKSCI